MKLSEAIDRVNEIDFASEVFENLLDDKDVEAIEIVVDTATGKRIPVTHDIFCSKCGKRKEISLNPNTQNSILKVAKSWSATGVLYCPKCTKEINKYTKDYETVLAVMLDFIAR